MGTPPRRASAVSRPPQGSRTSGRNGTPVCAAVRGPVSAAAQKDAAPLDCPRLRWAARRCSGPPSARQRARTDAAPCLTSLPPRGLTKEGTGAAALCPCGWIPLAPTPPPGALRIAAAPGGQRLRRSCRCRLCGLSSPPCQASQCTAAGLLRQGPASLACTSGRPPRSAPAQVEGVPGGPRCWRTAVAGTARAGDRRRTRVPDEARAWAGGQRGGSVPPHPSPVAALRVGRMVFYWPGCVRPGTGGGRVLLPLTACRGGGAPWRWPAPGSRRRLPVAAALFLPPQDAQCNPGGATSRAGLAPLGAPAHP